MDWRWRRFTIGRSRTASSTKLTVEKDTVFWDQELTGFGVRVYPTGGRVYVAQARGTRRTETGHGGVDMVCSGPNRPGNAQHSSSPG